LEVALDLNEFVGWVGDTSLDLSPACLVLPSDTTYFFSVPCVHSQSKLIVLWIGTLRFINLP